MLLLASLCAATLGCQQDFLQRAASSWRERILLGAEFPPPFPFPPLLLRKLKQDCAQRTHCTPAVVDDVLHGMVGLGGLSLEEDGAENNCSASFDMGENGLACPAAVRPAHEHAQGQRKGNTLQSCCNPRERCAVGSQPRKGC